MGHINREERTLVAQGAPVRGGVVAIERALESETGGLDLLQIICSVQGAMNGRTAEVLEDRACLNLVDLAREPIAWNRDRRKSNRHSRRNDIGATRIP